MIYSEESKDSTCSLLKPSSIRVVARNEMMVFFRPLLCTLFRLNWANRVVERYITDPELWRSPDEGRKIDQQNMELAHKSAYAEVCSYVDEMLIQDKGIVKLTDLLTKYTEVL